MDCTSFSSAPMQNAPDIGWLGRSGSQNGESRKACLCKGIIAVRQAFRNYFWFGLTGNLPRVYQLKASALP